MFMSSQPSISSARCVWALGLGVVTALCTVGLFLSLLVTGLELRRVGYDAPPFYPGIISLVGILVTLPPALICTAIALFLAGPRRSKLAWVSLCLYFLPFAIALLWHSFKRD